MQWDWPLGMVHKRIDKYKPGNGDKLKIHNSGGAYDILIENWNPSLLTLQEEFKMILLHNAG